MTASVDTPKDVVTLGSDRIAFRLTSEQSEGGVAVLEVRIPPGSEPPMLHRHDPFELYHVWSGELAIYLEGTDSAITRTVAGPGAVVPIPGGLEHTVRNESGEEAEAVVVFSPGEPMERFARAAGDLGRDRAPDPDQMLALAEAHGIDITRSIEDALSEAGEEETHPVPEFNAAYLTIARFFGDGDRLLAEYRKYSDVMSGVGRDHGLILHAGAKTDDGFLVVNLWPSKQGSEAAAGDRGGWASSSGPRSALTRSAANTTRWRTSSSSTRPRPKVLRRDLPHSPDADLLDAALAGDKALARARPRRRARLGHLHRCACAKAGRARRRQRRLALGVLASS
jgi:quercetin dioxygenase-like cupin family protein